MKTIWMFILTMTSFLTGFTQTEFAPIGAKWYFNQPSSPNSNYVYFESVKDTLVQNQSCRIIEVRMNGLKLISKEYLRQTNDSILYFNTNSNTFHLLYNFTAKVGDTITVHKGKFKPTKAFFSYNDSIPGFRYKIVSMDSIQVSGKWVKRQKVAPFKNDLWGFYKPDGNDCYVLDKVGSLAYFFGVQPGITPEDNSSILRCYSDSNFAFKNPVWEYDCGIPEKLVVNVGKDTTYCSDPNTTAIPMDLKVSVKNGIEPFTIAWECDVIPDGMLEPLTASDILNDSTLISPTIKKSIWIFSENKVKFILHLTDHLGNRAKDSISVDFSRCVWNLGYQVIEINKGDSIWFDAGTPQGSIAAYHWEPSYGLTNPNSSATWCKPEVKTDYFLTAIDTSGCACSNHVYEIRIITTNIDSKLNSESNINPIQKGLRVYFNNKMNQEALVSMFSLDGKLIHQCSSYTDNIDVSQILTKRGTYIIKITLSGNSGVCKYLKY